MRIIFTTILILISLTACASISSIKVQTEGNKITREQADKIQPGITTKNTIIETLGNPTKTESKTDGAEVLTYTYTEKKTPTYFGGFIVNENQSKTTTVTLEIIVKNGTVLSYNFKSQEE